MSAGTADSEPGIALEIKQSAGLKPALNSFRRPRPVGFR